MSNLHLHAALWLGQQFGADLTGYPDAKIEEFMDNGYPTGFWGFAEDHAMASAVS